MYDVPDNNDFRQRKQWGIGNGERRCVVTVLRCVSRRKRNVFPLAAENRQVSVFLFRLTDTLRVQEWTIFKQVEIQGH
jgi:hypothetical protein